MYTELFTGICYLHIQQAWIHHNTHTYTQYHTHSTTHTVPSTQYMYCTYSTTYTVPHTHYRTHTQCLLFTHMPVFSSLTCLSSLHSLTCLSSLHSHACLHSQPRAEAAARQRPEGQHPRVPVGAELLDVGPAQVVEHCTHTHTYIHTYIHTCIHAESE